MHPGILQQRDKEAQQRILNAARALAEGASLEILIEKAETVWNRDPALCEMFRREAIADVLEAVVAHRAEQSELEGTQDVPTRGRPPRVLEGANR